MTYGTYKYACIYYIYLVIYIYRVFAYAIQLTLLYPYQSQGLIQILQGWYRSVLYPSWNPFIFFTSELGRTIQTSQNNVWSNSWIITSSLNLGIKMPYIRYYSKYVPSVLCLMLVSWADTGGNMEKDMYWSLYTGRITHL